MPKENYAVLTVHKIFYSLKMEEIESLLGIYIKEAETKGIKIFKFIFSYSAHMTDESNLSYKLLLLCKALIDRNKVPIKLIMCVPGEEYISNQDQEASKKQGFEYEIIPHLYLAKREENLISGASLLIGTFSLRSMERYRAVRLARQYNIPVRNLLLATVEQDSLDLQRKLQNEYAVLNELIDSLINENILSQSTHEIQARRTLLHIRINQLLQHVCRGTEYEAFINSLIRENADR